MNEIELKETKFECKFTTNFLIEDAWKKGTWHINNSDARKIIGVASIHNGKYRILFESKKIYIPEHDNLEGTLKEFKDNCIKYLEEKKDIPLCTGIAELSYTLQVVII